jgi:hypothetical protein
VVKYDKAAMGLMSGGMPDEGVGDANKAAVAFPRPAVDADGLANAAADDPLAPIAGETALAAPSS